ncbi:MAG: DUF2460 domain-containing protein [Candidatus Solibacter usitatus]|nr:DUF2460 domain-containing protein [Candidatus Solibacter usitatus]
MRHYPLLGRGGAAQYPLARTREWRLPQAESPGGEIWRTTDATARRARWELRYRDLSLEEAAAIEALFSETKGGLGTFLFLDPLDNLIRSSTDLTAAAWQKDPMVAVTPGSEGFTVTNGAQAAGGVWQAVPLPASGAYSLSCRVRGVGEARLAVGGVGRSFVVGAEWSRVHILADTLAQAETTTVRISTPAGGSMEVAEPQLEAQAWPSPYKATTGRGGVYEAARFAQEGLTTTMEAPGRIAMRVVVESRLAG